MILLIRIEALEPGGKVGEAVAGQPGLEDSGAD
jgi:hypothetical protein